MGEFVDLTPMKMELLDEKINPEVGDLVREALQSQGDLREYSKSIEKELKEAEDECIKDYIRESKNIANIHNEIEGSFQMLEAMESTLMGFQADIGSLSSEIQTLQKQSLGMSVKLSNRQAVRSEISSFVDELVVPETLIRAILDSPVTDEEFLEQLKILRKKAQYVNTVQDTKGAQDVIDVITKLGIRATVKVREYLLSQIYKLRKPLANYQIPQNTLLKNKFLYEYLLKTEPMIAHEVKKEYLDTMSKVFLSYFKGYAGLLFPKQHQSLSSSTAELTSGKDQVITAVPEELKKKSKSKTIPATLFSLGKRSNILLPTELESPALVPHHQDILDEPYEALFRSLLVVLVDNTCREFHFLKDFFLAKEHSYQIDLFYAVMGKTLANLLPVIEQGMKGSWDAISLLLCVHIVLKLQMVAHKRDVPALDQFFSAVLDCVWPAFDKVLTANAESLTNCEIMPTDSMPHYITRRYSELVSGLAVIDSGFPQERVNRALLFLQEEMDTNIVRMACAFQQEPLKKLIFLINNYDLILSVQLENGVEPSENDKFRTALALKTEEYAEKILSSRFNGIIQFVQEVDRATTASKAQGTGGNALTKDDEARVTSLMTSFGSTWKQSLDLLNRDIMSSFPSFKTGAAVLQQALTILIQYYHQFLKIISESLPHLIGRQDLVNIHQVMVEVKKYKPNF